jgi:hypothetical protein
VGVFQPGAPNAKLLGRYVPAQSQVEEALRLDVYLGKPPKLRSVVLHHRGLTLVLYHPL